MTARSAGLGYIQMPSRSDRAEGHHCYRKLSAEIHYCLSYTVVLLILLPFASVPVVVTVRLLPSAAKTIRPLMVTLPPFLPLNPYVRSSIFVTDRVS